MADRVARREVVRRVEGAQGSAFLAQTLEADVSPFSIRDAVPVGAYLHALVAACDRRAYRPQSVAAQKVERAAFGTEQPGLDGMQHKGVEHTVCLPGCFGLAFACAFPGCTPPTFE